MRRRAPASPEVQEFLETFSRTDHAALDLERRVLFHVALVEAGLKEPDHPQALTFHRLEFGSCIMGGSLRHGYSRPYQPEPKVRLLKPEPTPWPLWPLAYYVSPRNCEWWFGAD